MEKQIMNKNIATRKIFSTIFASLIILSAILFSISAVSAAPLPATLNPNTVLGTAGNFVILAQTAITDVPTSAITGNIGISPAAESYITGFSQTDATGYATSPQVTGFIYAADMTPPTPSIMTTAIGDMGTAYTAVAAQTLGAASGVDLNVGAGILGNPITFSRDFVPGVYTWTTAVTIPNDIYLIGSSTDVWVFQVSGTLDISLGKQVHLSGGALAKNVFWQVTGQTTLGIDSVFKGNILDQTAIILNTGATLDGRALAQSAVNLLGTNTVTFPGISPGALVATTQPAAPSVTNDDNANTVSGMATGMEYKMDSANYTAYNDTNFTTIDFSGVHTLLVRIATAGINPASADTTLVFTTNPTPSPQSNQGSGSSGGSSGAGLGGCNANWVCSAWSACSNGLQTRTCNNTNLYCSTQMNKPSASQSCTLIAAGTVTNNTNTASGLTNANSSGITGAVTGVLNGINVWAVVIILLGLGVIITLLVLFLPKHK